jgi:hypothetical protein
MSTESDLSIDCVASSRSSWQERSYKALVGFEEAEEGYLARPNWTGAIVFWRRAVPI